MSDPKRANRSLPRKVTLGLLICARCRLIRLHIERRHYYCKIFFLFGFPIKINFMMVIDRSLHIHFIEFVEKIVSTYFLVSLKR